jgi:hypothetical protein
MRTTITLDDHVLADAKRLAAETGRTLGKVFEDAVRETLARRRAGTTQPRAELPVSRGGNGLQPGVDLDDSAALLDLMESHDRHL